MNVRIIKQGVLDTIRDLGRYGFQYLGVNPGGGMDTVAMKISNTLAGNDADEAVIELHFPASAFLFAQDALIALSGADFGAMINDQLLQLNTPIIVKGNSLLQFAKYNSGSCCYLAVHGGFDIPKWLNSYTTNLKAKAGGYYGRCLNKGDELPMRNQKEYGEKLKNRDCVPLPWRGDITSLYSFHKKIRICTGAEYPHLNDSSKNRLTSSSFIITPESDSMGYRMKGAPLRLQHPVELVSTAVTKGTIQLLPEGQLIILMADHQTTGGYPKIAHVVSADIPTLAQMQPHQTIQFQLIDHSEAEHLLWQQHQYLQILENACRLHWNEFFRSSNF